MDKRFAVFSQMRANEQNTIPLPLPLPTNRSPVIAPTVKPCRQNPGKNKNIKEKSEAMFLAQLVENPPKAVIFRQADADFRKNRKSKFVGEGVAEFSRKGIKMPARISPLT